METRGLTVTDASTRPADQYWAWLLTAIVSIAALIGMLPLLDDFFSPSFNVTAVFPSAKDSSELQFGQSKNEALTDESDADGFAVNAETIGNLVIMPSSPPQSVADISEEEREFSDNLQFGLVSPRDDSNILPQRQVIEEKIKQDLKNAIDRLSEAKKLIAQKPNVASADEPAPLSDTVPAAIIPRPAPEPALATPAEPEIPQQELFVADSEESTANISTDKTDDNIETTVEIDTRLSTSGAKTIRSEQRKRRQNKPATAGYRDEANAPATATATADQPSLAQQFLTQINSLDGLRYQPADGYWANTYVPGDPQMRQLAAGLQGAGLQLIQNIQQNRQPFDPPQNSALAVYLSTDKAFINQPSRLRVQLGLKGSLRQGGQRPAMNIAVVMDLRQSAADFNAIRSLLMALQQAQQPGDHFTLIAAGPVGGVLVKPEQFRFGPLQLALKRLANNTDAGQPALSLAKAITMAADQVRQSDDPNAVLGSSLVLLITPDSLANNSATLEPIVHSNALDGIFLSVVSIGPPHQQNAIQRLVLLGQGNLRRLDQPDQAKALIDRELYATSRAVARAIRLRIRLAAGVKLVDILGSYRLQEPEAQRVREAEQSIDRRMARNLGIKADRGEDEEGIQIVIPHFYAGDSHIILLDVVAERPGAIAEVTARYKDLVALGNGVAHTQLSVNDISRAPGPLQRNVLKNLLAFKLTQASRRASQQLVNGDSQQSQQTLLTIRQLFSSMRQHIPAWANDRELLHDERLLAAYLAQLSANSLPPEQNADALRYLAFRKLIPGGESL